MRNKLGLKDFRTKRRERREKEILKAITILAENGGRISITSVSKLVSFSRKVLGEYKDFIQKNKPEPDDRKTGYNQLTMEQKSTLAEWREIPDKALGINLHRE